MDVWILTQSEIQDDLSRIDSTSVTTTAPSDHTNLQEGEYTSTMQKDHEEVEGHESQERALHPPTSTTENNRPHDVEMEEPTATTDNNNQDEIFEAASPWPHANDDLGDGFELTPTSPPDEGNDHDRSARAPTAVCEENGVSHMQGPTHETMNEISALLLEERLNETIAVANRIETATHSPQPVQPQPESSVLPPRKTTIDYILESDTIFLRAEKAEEDLGQPAVECRVIFVQRVGRDLIPIFVLHRWSLADQKFIHHAVIQGDDRVEKPKWLRGDMVWLNFTNDDKVEFSGIGTVEGIEWNGDGDRFLYHVALNDENGNYEGYQGEERCPDDKTTIDEEELFVQWLMWDRNLASTIVFLKRG